MKRPDPELGGTEHSATAHRTAPSSNQHQPNQSLSQPLFNYKEENYWLFAQLLPKRHPKRQKYFYFMFAWERLYLFLPSANEIAGR